MYALRILPQAQKDLDRLRGKVFDLIKKAILSLASDPRPHGAAQLINQEGYRIRVGDYRALYRVDDKAREVFIYRIKHRREAYR